MNSGNYKKNQGKASINKRKLAAYVKLAAMALCMAVAVILLFTAVFKLFSGGDGNSDKREASVEATHKKEYNMPPASEKNDILEIVRGIDRDEKVCYLTFDDGPTKEITPKVLDELKKYNVKATFFCLGKMLDANPDIAKRAYDEGHLIANHSYNHDYKTLYATSESFMDEINKTQDKIKEITGEEPFKLIRFPGGGYNAGDHAAEKQVYKACLKENGFYYADWNCLNGDAEASLRSADELVAKVKQTALEDNIIVLMHDAATKTTTPQALGRIIEYLKEKGYEFKRLDEIEYYDTGSRPDENSMIL